MITGWVVRKGDPAFMKIPPNTGYIYSDAFGGLPNNFDFAQYHVGEKTILTPWLVSHGCKLLSNWYTGEQDSCGPLSRCVKVSYKGEQLTFVYG